MIAWVGLGANLGDARGTLARAVAALDEGPARVLAVSSLYHSRPLGPADQPDYLNAALRLATALGPRALLERMQGIEAALGRRPRPRWRERELDLDLLLAWEDGALLTHGEGLELPHPGLRERAFVLAPLLELDPGLADPRDGRRLEEEWRRLAAHEPDAVRRVEGAQWCRMS